MLVVARVFDAPREWVLSASGPIPGNMTFYIDVGDLAAFRKKIIAAGGRIHVEEQAVPGIGAFSLFSDPEGRMEGIWKTATK